MPTERPYKKLFRKLCLLLGILSAAFGLGGFLLPLGFIDGGITGLSMLVAHALGQPLWALLLVLNLPFILLGWQRLGTRFALRSALSIAGFAAALALIKFPLLTNQPLLAAIFGGVFLGAGIALAIRSASVLDGTEVLALVLSRGSMLSVGTVVLCFNVLLFFGAAFILGPEPAMYSILSYAAASKTLDFVLYGLDEYYGIQILSAQSDKIRTRILEELGRGVTRFQARGGHAGAETEVLFSVVTRLEVNRMKAIALEEDESAFVVIQHVSDLSGGTVQTRAALRLFEQG